MKQGKPSRHWSQLSTEEQVRFWQGVDASEAASFLVPAGPRKPAASGANTPRGRNVKIRGGSGRRVTNRWVARSATFTTAW